MKKINVLLLMVILTILFNACQKEDTFLSSNSSSSLKNPESISNGFDKDSLQKPSKASLSLPSISKITGSYGSSIPNTHPLYNSYLLASYSGSQVTITGSNFGSLSGSLSLEKKSGSNWLSATSYSINIISWSNNKIVINLTSSLSSEPISTSRFKVYLSNSSVVTSGSVSIVPSISGRLFGECTYQAIKRTLQCGLSGWSGAYNANQISITANYIPSANDVLFWNTSHQAFIESVNVSVSGNITTYSLNISEMNVISGTAEGGNYSSAIASYTTVIKIKKNISSGAKSFVSGYSSYRSNLKSGASGVRIQ